MSAVPYAAERGTGEPAIVFLHGIGGDHRAFEGELEHFGRRARALAWDMPGYGKSAPIEPMTFPTLADALASLLDAHGIASAILVGHSMGGMVAQEFVATRPERVTALVLVGTTPAFGSPDGAWQQKFMADRMKPLEGGKTPADIAPERVADLVGDEPDPRGVTRAIECMSGISVPTFRAALGALLTFDRRASLGSIGCPTLMIAGERDRVAAPEVMEKMCAAIPGAVCHVMSGAGHLMNLEQPDAFARLIDDFLDLLP